MNTAVNMALSELARRVVTSTRQQVTNAVDRARVKAATRHVHGPRTVELADDECFAVCLVKDGAPFLPEFLDHHFALGIKHIAFMDNGSTDGTLDIIRKHPRTTIYANHLPAREYESLLRRELIYRMGRDQWCVILDADELFDYPRSAALPLPRFLSYLNHHGYNAVVGQMLDLFPACTVSELGDTTAQYIAEHRFYDLATISKHPYHDQVHNQFWPLLHDNVVDPSIQFHYGGIRRALFGTNNCLTKHPLVRVNGDLVPSTHPHCSSYARCADVTALLKHYRFAGEFVETARKQLEAGAWAHGEVDAYVRSSQENPLMRFNLPTSREMTSVDDLVQQGFLVTSPRFDTWT